jgi:dynein heavy chain
MLREYNEAVHTLSPIEKKLLESHIQKLNKVLDQGYESKNLSSLGINEFIDNCRVAINSFRDMKKKVAKSAGMIEEIVRNIEDAVILKEFDFEARKDSPYNATEFAAYSDEHLQRTVAEISEKYNIIGEQFLKNIEESILGTNTKCAPLMKEYYYYWERRVYNALFKMILRALVSFKALISQTATPGGKSYPLFQIRANY